jgi:predicted dienelactone hydrolase
VGVRKQPIPILVVGLVTVLVSALPLLGLPSPLAGASGEDDFLPPARFNVGYRVLDLDYLRDGKKKVLTVAIWYPTATQPKLHVYGGPTKGDVAVDAPPLAEKGPFPLLVVSHGYGGSGLGAVFFTEALAARGWVVAAPDHHDRDSAVRIRGGQLEHFDRIGLLRRAREIAASGPEDRARYLYRLDEMKLVVDRLTSAEPFRSVVDAKRIAVGGHSLGGFTALGLSGPIPAYHDPRISAVLLFSTGAGGYLFTEGELRAVRIPSMLMRGERERNERRGTATMSELSEKIFRSVSPPKYFLEVKGASHFSFNDRLADTVGARLLSGTPEQFAVIRKYSIAFLETYVAGRNEAAAVLQQGDPRLSGYLRETASPAP